MSGLPPMNASTAALNPHVGQAGSVKGGTGAKRSGTSFEDAIAAELKALHQQGKVAAYSRHDARKIESKGVVKGRVPGACDFSGILPNGARGFCIEVKSTAKGGVWVSREHATAAKRSREPALTGEQLAQLRDYVRADGLAFLAARVAGVVSVVQWQDVTVAKDGRLTWQKAHGTVREALAVG